MNQSFIVSIIYCFLYNQNVQYISQEKKNEETKKKAKLKEEYLQLMKRKPIFDSNNNFLLFLFEIRKVLLFTYKRQFCYTPY